MLNVCNILFRYSTVIHLPSNKTELIWSISTTTPLFGLKFIVLFTVCIVLFLIMLPFNIILLFARRLSHFKLVTKLKPLLDTYFSVYKDKAYYWTGLLLLIRLIVYILSTINKDTIFITTSILFAGLLCLHGIVQPFKSKFHNIQESLTIVNLLAVHVTILYKKTILGLEVPQVLLTVGLVYYIPAVIVLCCMHRWKKIILKGTKWLYRKLCICKTKLSQENNFNEMESLSSRIADVAYNYKEFQEPLVEFDD